MYTQVEKISSGATHSLILTKKGLFSCGNNSHGQLGVGKLKSSRFATLQKINTIDNEKILSIFSRFNSNFVITSNGVYAWGQNDCGQLGLNPALAHFTPEKLLWTENKDVLTIAIGFKFSLILMQNKQLWFFGKIEKIIPTTAPNLLTVEGKTIKHIAAGLNHFFVLADDGTLFGYGSNRNGQLGLGNVPSSTTLQEITSSAFNKVLDIACGGHHTIALTDKGLFSWGQNNAGQLGISSDILNELMPKKIEINSNQILSIAASLEQSYILTSEGLYVCGNNRDGQLGLSIKTKHSTPMRLPFKEKIKDIALGCNHCLFIDAEQNVIAFGKNEKGQLGLTTLDCSKPAQLSPRHLTSFQHSDIDKPNELSM